MTQPNLDLLTVTVKVDRSRLSDPAYVEQVAAAAAEQARAQLHGEGGADTIAEAVRQAHANPGQVATVRL